MELKRRFAAIIQEVLATDSGVAVDSILSRYRITRRTFYYDVVEINKWMKENSYGSAKVSNHHLVFVSNKRDEMQKKLACCPYYYAALERKVFTFFYIALTSRAVKIDTLQKRFDVSKNTIATDIRELKRALTQTEISLFSTSRQGYLLQGEEHTIRKMLGVYYRKLAFCDVPKLDIRKLMQQEMTLLTDDKIHPFDMAMHLFKQYEIETASQLCTQGIALACMMMVSSWIRSLKGNHLPVHAVEKAEVKNTTAYRYMLRKRNVLDHEGIHLAKNEVDYMTGLLLGIRIAQCSHQEQGTLFIHCFVDQLIKKFQVIACIQINEKPSLTMRLRTHLRSFYYRLQYGLQEENVLLYHVQKMYPEAFDFCKQAIKEIDSDFARIIDDDEIAYLTTYLMGTQETKYRFALQGDQEKRIVLVSEGSCAESILLIKQVIDLFGAAWSFETIQYNHLEDVNLATYNLVLTTTKSMYIDEGMDKNIVWIDRFLNEHACLKIIKYLSAQGITYKKEQIIQQIILDVKQNVSTSYNEEKLYMAIFRSIYKLQQQELKQTRGHAFEIFMKERRYHYVSGKTTWRRILWEGYKGVYGNELARKKLSIKNSIQTQASNLYNITDVVVLVYCYDATLIHEERVILVVSNQKLEITEASRGQIFVFFASRNNDDHFQFLTQIYAYYKAMSSEEIERLLKEGEEASV